MLSPYLTADSSQIRSLKVYHNGLLIASFAPGNGTDDSIFSRDYSAFVEFADALDKPFCVDLQCFRYGSTFFSVNLLQSCETQICSSEVILSGYLSVELELKKEATENLILMCVGLSPATMDIDKNMNCRFTRGVV